MGKQRGLVHNLRRRSDSGWANEIGGTVQERAVEILNSNRTMAISTLRPDGWPQTTIVGFANEGLSLYFLIFRTSQKLANIRRDKRISIAVGGEAKERDQ